MMKNNTNELRKALKTKIEASRSGLFVFYGNTVKPTTYPYVGFELKENFTQDSKTACTLFVRCVSKDEATTQDIADEVAAIFDHLTYNSEYFFFETFKAQRYEALEEDKSIKRIDLNIELNLYLGKEL